MLSGKPYFTLAVDANACAGFILLNGQLQYAPEILPVKLVLPVNHWMHTGENDLRMMLAPVDERGEMGRMSPAARCRLTLQVRISGTGPEGDATVAALCFDNADPEGIGGNAPRQRLSSKAGFSPSAKGDVRVGAVKRESFQEVVTVVSRTVSLPKMGLPTWKFVDSDDVTGIGGPDIDGRLDDGQVERLKGELLPIYRRIWDALRDGTVDDILPLYAERCAETDASLYRKPGETAARLAQALKDSVADPGQKLWPITDENVMVNVSDNDKLVRLCQNNQKPLLSFDIVGDGACHYDAVFRKAGRKWILTR